MSTKIEILKSSFTQRLDEMVSRAKNIKSYMVRVAYPQYQRAQIERWETENKSEGVQWKPLNERYAEYKLKTFAGYDYGGTRMLVATGLLFQSVVGTERKYHRRIVADWGFEVRVTLPYAPYVNRVRPFMVFGDRTRGEILRGMRNYLTVSK